MDKWRRFATEVMERFPPGFLMAVFLLALYRGLDMRGQIPAIDWIAERFGITASFWQTLFLLAAFTIIYFRPEPKYTLLLSLPAAFLGGGILWYGVATGRDVIAMVYIFAAWFMIGMGQVVMVLYQEQLVANELMAKKVAELQKDQPHADVPSIPPAAPTQ